MAKATTNLLLGISPHHKPHFHRKYPELLGPGTTFQGTRVGEHLRYSLRIEPMSILFKIFTCSGLCSKAKLKKQSRSFKHLVEMFDY